MPNQRIVHTFLSRKPNPKGRWLGLISVIVCFAVSALCWEPNSTLGDRWSALPEAVFNGHEYWRLFTSMAVHADSEHLVSNAIPLALLSSLIYGYYGAWIYPLGMLLAGALTMGIADYTYPAGTYLMGASGLIYVMAGFWLVLYLFVDRRYSLGQRLFRASGFSLIFLVPTSYKAGISYRTHGIGFALGILFGAIYFLIARNRLRSFDRIAPDEDDDQNLDYENHLAT